MASQADQELAPHLPDLPKTDGKKATHKQHTKVIIEAIDMLVEKRNDDALRYLSVWMGQF